MIRKPVAIALIIVIVTVLTLAVANIINWLYFYSAAALIGAYMWYDKEKETKKI